MGRYISFIPKCDASIRFLDLPIVSACWVQSPKGHVLIQIENEGGSKIPNLLRGFVEICGSVETFVLNNTGYRFGDEQEIEIIERDGLLLLDISSNEIWDISISTPSPR